MDKRADELSPTTPEEAQLYALLSVDEEQALACAVEAA